MSDYALVRTRSAVSLTGPRPTVLLSRTYSVPDLSVYRPTYSSYYYYPYYSWRSLYPYRYRDYWLSDYSYYYPYSYRSWFPYRSYYYNDYSYSPYSWYYPYSYWSRYKSYWYDLDYPYYYRRWYDPYYNSYLGSYRYRSWLLDSEEDSLHKGLALYRQGTISFDRLHRNWLSSMSWHQRHKDWRRLYLWDKEAQRYPGAPPPDKDYKAEWVPGFNPA